MRALRVCVTAMILFLAAGWSTEPPLRITANDNRRPAGELREGVLTLRLVATEGLAFPEGPGGPSIPIEAFAEEGREPEAPGPLIRMPVGTQVRITVRNALARPMLVRGLYDRAAAPDSFDLGPGDAREVRFTATRPGTYYYWGRTQGDRRLLGVHEDSQLLGALIVDEPGARTDDRIMVVSLWEELTESPVSPGRPGPRHTFMVNGLSWPHTERLEARVSDTLHWRIINANVAPHPMHLHGFYFDVLSRGNALRDEIFPPDEQRLAVTELMTAGTTMRMRWVPRRAGNWMLHCHFIRHITAEQRLGERHASAAPPPGAEHAHGVNHAMEEMAGLAIGVVVQPGPGGLPPEDPTVPRRKLRLYANERPRFFGERPGYGFVLQADERAPARDSVVVPGSAIVLTRGEPTEIMVINRVRNPVSVHWHGIELESYYDGVAGWSGDPTRLAPLIMPGDSFRVWMTPDRAGTFIYHTHAEEGEQLAAGLYGPLVIVEPGETWDPDIDRVFLMGWAGSAPMAAPILNGEIDPAPIELETGRSYRLRFINIMPSNRQRIRLQEDTVPVRWRAFAKDGAYLPPHQAVERPAVQTLGSGETYDFELRSDEPRELILSLEADRRRAEPARMSVPLRFRKKSP